MATNRECRFCGRHIILTEEGWVDPLAVGDDAVWRETCDAHDTFSADHRPAWPTNAELYKAALDTLDKA
jgi:hypothetical protein